MNLRKCLRAFGFLVIGGLGFQIAGCASGPSAETLPWISPVDYDYIVAEVSSFQLETIRQFKPWIAVLLNVTSDHLDRYPTQKDYQAAKRRIFENQTEQDWMVLNAEDLLVRALSVHGKARRCHDDFR